MELTIEELKSLSHYFNQQVSLPGDVQSVAAKVRELINPTDSSAEETLVKKIVKRVTKK